MRRQRLRAAHSQPAFAQVPKPSAIMENYDSGWPLQLSTGARAASRASTTWRAQREARAASGEPLWRELRTLGLALGSHSPQIAPRDHGKLWFWPAVAGPSQARRPRLGAHVSPYAWASAGRGKACSLLYINALRYTPQNHPSTGGARFGSQSSRSYLHRVLARSFRGLRASELVFPEQFEFFLGKTIP